MGGGGTGAPAEGGQEGDEGLGGSKGEEPDAASRWLPPQPGGLMAKSSHAASPGLNGEPAPPCARFLAWKPFAINAAPIDYLDALQNRHVTEVILLGVRDTGLGHRGARKLD